MATNGPKVDVVVVDNYTTVVASQFNIKRNAEKIYFSGNNQNFELFIADIEKFIGHAVHPLVMDLYRIAATVYICDLRIKRQEKFPTRSISILISVSDKSKWDSEKQHLESTLRFLSGDIFTFHFIQGARTTEEFKFKEANKKVVSLLSGGLDSLAGVKWLTDKGVETILVSHCANNKICHAQTTIYSALTKIFGSNLKFFQVKARVKPGSGFNMIEFSQANRSFLYLSMACLFGLEIGTPTVYMFENGILALNIPIVPSRIFRNTKTAHPKFLKNYNILIHDIFPNSVHVENPFILMTKGEVVKLLDDNNFRNLIKETITCSYTDRLRWRGVANSNHCGICLPCVLRRAAIHHAGLWGFDDNYVDNIFGEFNSIPQDGRTLLFQLIEFGRILQKNDEDIINDLPEFYVEELDPSQLIAMTRRYIDELKITVNDKGSVSLKNNLSI